MVKPDIFDIVFDDPNRVYQPGKHVSGHVELQLSKEMKTTGVFVTIFGGAETNWTESESKSVYNSLTRQYETQFTPVFYRDREVYIESSVTLWGNGKAQILPAGRHSFPFSVCLPNCCLPSFQGSMGKIRYYCRAKIARPWRFDHKVKEMFTVLPVYDLSKSPTMAVGVSAEDSKKLGCLCCVAGTVIFQITIPKAGFVPGERIKATVHFDNQSSRPLRSVKTSLSQVVTYKGTRSGTGSHKTKQETRQLSATTENLRGKPVSSKYSVTRDILIPSVVATMGTTNSIIQVKYLLKCNFIPTGFSIGCNIQIPITVGTIPVWQRPKAPPSDSGNTVSSNQPPALPTIEPLPAEPPPPTYKECMFGKVDAHDDGDNEHTRGNFAFAPKYPVYRF